MAMTNIPIKWESWTDSNRFEEICQQLLVAEFDDYVATDQYHDKGVDGYRESAETAFSIWCPDRPSQYDNQALAKVRQTLAELPKAETALATRFTRVVMLSNRDASTQVLARLRQLKGESGRQIDWWGKSRVQNLIKKHPHVTKGFPEFDGLNVAAGLIDAQQESELPRLVLELGGYEGGPQGTFLTINVSNYGKTPALNVVVTLDGVSQTPPAPGAVEPGHPKRCRATLTEQPLLTQKLAGPKVRVTYKDIFGESHACEADLIQIPPPPTGSGYQIRLGETRLACGPRDQSPCGLA